MDSSKANLVLEKNNKNLGLADTPPPLIGPQFQVLAKVSYEGFCKALCVYYSPPEYFP